MEKQEDADMRHIRYKKGFKYQLDRDYQVLLPFAPRSKVSTRFITFDVDGMLYLKAGYASDGPSGPTIDTHTFMRGAFVHDALYQLIRYGLLDESYRKLADLVLRDICLEDGMMPFRAFYAYRGVRRGGTGAADPKNKKKVYTAPKVKI